MKFTKFVKSLASEGVIYETNQILEKRWLASVSVLMAIPDTVRSVTASDIKEAPGNHQENHQRYRQYGRCHSRKGCYAYRRRQN